MAKAIARIGNAIRRVGDKIGLSSCCCGCCEYGAIFPINFQAAGTTIEGNPFNVSGTAEDFIWSDEAGNVLTIGPCSEIPEENVYLSSVPGFLVSFLPAGSMFTLAGGIPTEYVENWPCDQIKNITGMSAYLVGAFQVNVGSVTFSE